MLSYSNSYYPLWYNASQRLKAALYTPEQPSKEVAQSIFTEDEVRELYVRYYEKFARYEHQLLTANGVRSYFFLQPNQYVENSKTFSEQERATALGYGSERDREEIKVRYRLLREKIRNLHDAGVDPRALRRPRPYLGNFSNTFPSANVLNTYLSYRGSPGWEPFRRRRIKPR